MTEIILLGTFHFLESNMDFYSDEVQNQIELLVQRLLRFNPDTIAVEASVDAQAAVDSSYVKLKLSDFKNNSKMKTETLGDIKMFGDIYPITYKNEAIQIGYRLGKMLDLNNVYAIDDDTNVDMSAIDNKPKALISAENNLQKYIHDHQGDSIIDFYKCYNTNECSLLSHAVYLQINSIHNNGDYLGAALVSKWYERNLKIFSNIQRLAFNSNRLFILYGAGHLKILKDLINATDNLKLIDIYDYL